MPRPWVRMLAAYVAATAAAVVAILIPDWDFEMTGAGLLAPLLVVPSIVGYEAMLWWKRSRVLASVVYAVLAAPMILWCLYVAVFPSEGALSDAADQVALLISRILAAASIAAWLALKQLSRPSLTRIESAIDSSDPCPRGTP